MTSPVSTRSARRLLLAAGTVLVLAGLAGCARPDRDPAFTGTVDLDGYRTRHPILVEEGEAVLDLPVASHTARMPVSLIGAVEAFGRESRQNGGGRVVVMTPLGSTNEAAVRRVQREVVDALVRSGVAATSIERRNYTAEGPNDAAPIRLSHTRLVAQVPHRCGQWPNQAIGHADNSDYWNFGCAYQANMAAMVANPADLVAPAPLGGPDATRRATVLAKYRKGEKTMSETGLPAPGVSSVSGGGSQ